MFPVKCVCKQWNFGLKSSFFEFYTSFYEQWNATCKKLFFKFHQCLVFRFCNLRFLFRYWGTFSMWSRNIQQHARGNRAWVLRQLHPWLLLQRQRAYRPKWTLQQRVLLHWGCHWPLSPCGKLFLVQTTVLNVVTRRIPTNNRHWLCRS